MTKQRNILLLEADYNFNNKLIESRIMKNGEKLKSIAKGQYGSRKSFTPIDHALNKKLYFDILRQTRKVGALCSNDAKSYYDRINLAIASLCMRRLGMPLAPIKSMIQTLLHTKHSLRTSYSDYDEVFDAALEEYIHGIGQGNGAAPTLWAMISTVLLNILRSKKYGATISSASMSKKIKVVGFAFVDDKDIVQTTEKKIETLEKVYHDLQKAIDLWEGGLKATRGSLVPEKIFWYGIEFEWEEGRWKWKAVNTTIMMSLKYSLLALTLNEKECKKIVAPVLKVSLPMSEVNRHFPHALVYAPTNRQGLGLTNIYDFQGASHVECIQNIV